MVVMVMEVGWAMMVMGEGRAVAAVLTAVGYEMMALGGVLAVANMRVGWMVAVAGMC